MKRYATIIIGFVFLGAAVILGVAGWKVLGNQQQVKDEATYQGYLQKYRTQQSRQPAKLSPSPTPKQLESTPTAAPAGSISELNRELQMFTDDGGKSDLESLQADLNQL